MKTNLPITTSAFIKNGALAVALSAFAFSASAAPSPYANAGVENLTQYSFTATTSGDIVAYFVGKGDAVYPDTLSISVNGVATGIDGLTNQTSAYGQSLNFGFANAGDSIVFSISVLENGNVWHSTKSLNSDGANHVYSAAFGGDELVPAGTYVAFEDLSAVSGPKNDFNYLDAQFVITNVTPATVPVPATVWLFSTGLLGLAGVTRRRSKIV